MSEHFENSLLNDQLIGLAAFAYIPSARKKHWRRIRLKWDDPRISSSPERCVQDLNDIAFKDEDEGYYYNWFAGIQPLMRKEGYMAGSYLRATRASRLPLDDAFKTCDVELNDIALKNGDEGYYYNRFAGTHGERGSSRRLIPRSHVHNQRGETGSKIGFKAVDQLRTGNAKDPTSMIKEEKTGFKMLAGDYMKMQIGQ